MINLIQSFLSSAKSNLLQVTALTVVVFVYSCFIGPGIEKSFTSLEGFAEQLEAFFLFTLPLISAGLFLKGANNRLCLFFLLFVVATDHPLTEFLYDLSVTLESKALFYLILPLTSFLWMCVFLLRVPLTIMYYKRLAKRNFEKAVKGILSVKLVKLDSYFSWFYGLCFLICCFASFASYQAAMSLGLTSVTDIYSSQLILDIEGGIFDLINAVNLVLTFFIYKVTIEDNFEEDKPIPQSSDLA